MSLLPNAVYCCNFMQVETLSAVLMTYFIFLSTSLSNINIPRRALKKKKKKFNLIP